MNTDNKEKPTPERVEEQPAEQRSDEAIIVCDGGKHYVPCPACGLLVPTRHDSFDTQEAADCEALTYCECEAAREWRKIKPHRPNVRPFAVDNAPPELEMAPCRFCGQVQPVPLADLRATGLPAVEFVTRLCRCGAAQSYQSRLEEERRRAEDLQRAAENIDNLFGPPEYGENEKQEKARRAATALLKTACELIYDLRIEKITLGISYTTTATVGRNSKGNIKIGKSVKSGESVEI